MPKINLRVWLNRIFEIRKSTHLDLVKIDTDSIDGLLLDGFLAGVESFKWSIESFIFEGTGVKVGYMRRLHLLGYELYRLNVHIGLDIYTSTGYNYRDNDRKIPNYFEFRHGVRGIRSMWRVKHSYFESDLWRTSPR